MPGPPRRSRALPLALLLVLSAAAQEDGRPGQVGCKATAVAALREAEGTATFLGAFEAALEGSHRFREAYLATPFLDAAAAPTATTLAVPTDAAFAAFAQAMGIEVNDFVRPDLLETTATTLWNHFVAYGGGGPTCGLESEGGSLLESAAGARSTCPVAWQRVHDGALMVEGACGDRAGVVEALRVCGEAAVYIVDQVLVPAAFCESEPFRSYLARAG